MFWVDLLLRLYIEPRVQGTTVNLKSSFSWLVQTKTWPQSTAALLKELLYLRSDSGRPNPPGSNLQSADSLVQAGLDRADSDRLTDVYGSFTFQMSFFKRRKQAGCIERPDGYRKRISGSHTWNDWSTLWPCGATCAMFIVLFFLLYCLT